MVRKKKKGEPETKRTGKMSKEKSLSTDTGNLGESKPPEIPDMLSPYDIFLRCIKRAQNLVDFHASPEQKEEDKHFDAYRAAVVLSIAALDAFIRTIVIDKIKEKLIKQRKLPKELYTYIKNVMTHDTLIECARLDIFLQTISEQITIDFQTKSFQGERKISYYMELAGYKNIFSIVSEKANKFEKNLVLEIEKYTTRRHTIAHGGDYNINQTPYKENEISKSYAEGCINIVSEFAKHLNEICNKK